MSNSKKILALQIEAKRTLMEKNKALQARLDEIEPAYDRCSKLFIFSVRNKTQIWPDDLGHALYGDEWETKAQEIKT